MINVQKILLNILPANQFQKPHRHNSVALDLCVFSKGHGVYTLMGPELEATIDLTAKLDQIVKSLQRYDADEIDAAVSAELGDADISNSNLENNNLEDNKTNDKFYSNHDPFISDSNTFTGISNPYNANMNPYHFSSSSDVLVFIFSFFLSLLTLLNGTPALRNNERTVPANPIIFNPTNKYCMIMINIGRNEFIHSDSRTFLS